MRDTELEKLEKNIKSLILISSELKQVNESLLEKNLKLQKVNSRINIRLSATQTRIRSLIAELKTQIKK
jgi:regulator of replication initiation timing